MVEGANEQLVQQLKDGTCNLILLRSYGEPPSGDFVSIPLLSDHIALVIAAGSIFDDGRDSVTWKELEDAELITSTSTRQDAALKEFTKRNNIHLNVVSKLSRTPSIIEMLHKGIGNAALLNRYVTKMYVSDPKIRILDITPTLSNDVFLVYMKERPLTNAMRNFIDIALEHASTGES
jgi:DNA-binding transcriptional LysR family regulator